MDSDAIGLPDLLKLMGFPSPREFDGMFVDLEQGHVELRLSCPRGTRRHCAPGAGSWISRRTTFGTWFGSIIVSWA